MFRHIPIGEINRQGSFMAQHSDNDLHFVRDVKIIGRNINGALFIATGIHRDSIY